MAALKAHLLRNNYTKPLASLKDVTKFVLQGYPSLEVKETEICDGEGVSRWVVVCCTYLTRVEGRPVHTTRMVFDSDGTYVFEVLMHKVNSGSWLDSPPPHNSICNTLSTLLASSGYVLCPGIRDFRSEFSKTVRFSPKHLRVWTQVSRYDSEECSMWLKPSNNKIPAGSVLMNTCKACRLLYRSLVAIKGRLLEASPDHKDKWAHPSSNRPLKYLSPASQSKRAEKRGDKLRQVRCACTYTCTCMYMHTHAHMYT